MTYDWRLSVMNSDIFFSFVSSSVFHHFFGNDTFIVKIKFALDN